MSKAETSKTLKGKVEQVKKPEVKDQINFIY